MKQWKGFENFFYIQKIELVLFVTKKLTAKRMENRKNHGLVYYDRAYGKLTFGDTIIEPQAGQLVYFPQGSSYDIDVTNAAETSGCFAVNFLAPDLRQNEPFVFEPKSPQVFSSLFARAEKAWKEKRPAYEEKCLEILYAALAALKEGAAYSPSAHKRLLAPAAEYIHEHYAEKRLYGAQLAALCGVSETYFRRLFFEVYGVTPVAYINALRVQRAKDLLSERGAQLDKSGEKNAEKSGNRSDDKSDDKSGDSGGKKAEKPSVRKNRREGCTIGEIAELCGFPDVFYFTRLFKKATGTPPAKWR